MELGRLFFGTLLSAAMTLSVLGTFLALNAWRVYQTSIALVRSKVFSTILLFDAIIAFSWAYFCARWMLFGTVLPHEWDGIWEIISFDVVQSLFSLSYFKEAIDFSYAAHLLITLCANSLHTLGKARLATLEQSEPHERSTRRNLVAFLCLFGIDCGMLWMFSKQIRAQGFGVAAYLFMRWSLMLLQSAFLSIKAFLLSNDKKLDVQRMGLRYYADLVHNFSHCVLELVYFFFLLKNIGVPMHFMREIYLAIVGVAKSAKQAMTYQRHCTIIESLEIPNDASLPTDDVCIICMESFHIGDVKKLPCGHLFHSLCLYRYVETNTACAICRRTFVKEAPAAKQEAPVSRAFEQIIEDQGDHFDEAQLGPARSDLQRVLRLMHMKAQSMNLPDIPAKRLKSYAIPTLDNLREAYLEYLKAYVYLQECESRQGRRLTSYGIYEKLSDMLWNIRDRLGKAHKTIATNQKISTGVIYAREAVSKAAENIKSVITAIDGAENDGYDM